VQPTAWLHAGITVSWGSHAANSLAACPANARTSGEGREEFRDEPGEYGIAKANNLALARFYGELGISCSQQFGCMPGERPNLR